MTYDARQITNWFIERAASDGRVLSIMSLLKLVYIAHGWNLEMRNEPLFHNKIEAWQYGPVISEVYKTFRPQGIGPSLVAPGFERVTDTDDIDFLEEIYNIYGQMPPFQLSEITHQSGGPWEIAKKVGGWYAEIPDDLIKPHYVQKRQLWLQTNT